MKDTSDTKLARLKRRIILSNKKIRTSKSRMVDRHEEPKPTHGGRFLHEFCFH